VDGVALAQRVLELADQVGHFVITVAQFNLFTLVLHDPTIETFKDKEIETKGCVYVSIHNVSK